ncbi:MAG: glycosyltransferase [Candidatus Berkelbacteria bacterium]|nr:glycosyltransferase [Candidatus Berkelbacteria bacterium]
MKILHMPLTVPGSEQVGQEKGLREVFGEGYLKFDYLPMEGQQGKEATNQTLVNIVKEFKPDIVWAQIQETTTITPKTWETIRKENPNLWLTTWSGDARDYVPQNLQQILPFFDIFYNDTDQVDMYKPYLESCRYEFMPIAVDPDEATDYSHPTGPVPEIVFIGNHYANTFSNGQFRKELMMALSREFGDKFGVYGTGWNQGEVNWVGMCPVKHQGAYYNRAKVVVSVDHIKGILHWSERLIWAMMSGTPVIVEYQPGIEERLTSINTIASGPSTDGFIAACHDALGDELGWKFKKVAEYAKIEAMSKHTWKQRAERIKLDYEAGKQN